MGSKAGAEKGAAARIGVTLSEYRAHRAAGRKWCRLCSDWQREATFGLDRSRTDGLASTCRLHSTTDGPSRFEREQMGAMSLAWCSRCRWWIDVADVRNGLCRAHQREREREWYRDGGHVYRRGRAAARRRGVDPVPGEWREELLAEGCAYCPADATSIDHFIPVASGGQTTPGNVVPACGPCNSAKRDSDPVEWLPRLRVEWWEKLGPLLLGDGAVAEVLGL